MRELRDAAAECRAEGFSILQLSGRTADDLPLLESLLRVLGQPIRVFRRHPFWKPLAADPARPPGRSGGVGLNSLHADCVNARYPPDFLCLYCVRADPLGGATMVASVDDVETQLTSETLRTLSRAVFQDGAVYDLDHVGPSINPFPVYAAKGWRWRYTGRLLESGTVAPGSAEYSALLEFDRIMMSRTKIIQLKAGHAAIVDQRRILHGRLTLSPSQESLPPDRRRLLIQAYGKDNSHE